MFLFPLGVTKSLGILGSIFLSVHTKDKETEECIFDTVDSTTLRPFGRV